MGVVLFSIFFSYITVVINTYSLIKVYSIAINKKLKLNVKKIIGILINSLVTYIINNNIDSRISFILSFVVLLVSYIYFFREENKIKLIFKTLLIYVVLSMCDSILVIIYCLFPMTNNMIKTNIYLMSLNSILVSLLIILLFLIKPVIRLVRRLFKYIEEKFNCIYLIFVFLTFIVFISITYFNALRISIKMLLYSMFILSFFLVLCLVLIFQYFKTKHQEEEQKSLLELMNEYEKLLDNERINRHEILNNLIILKSYKNKSSKKYEDILDSIIEKYNGKKGEIYTKLYKLPSGIKGIIYYKMGIIKDNEIKLNLVISEKVKVRFEDISERIYYKVCKILGILIDNAVEAAAITEEKQLLIDIYNEEEELIIYIENSCGEVEMEDIYKKGYSSKGSYRGYGLYIVNKIIKESELLDINQYVENNRFISILKIKNPSS